VRSRARPHTDERWSGSTCAARRSTTRGSAADGGCEEIQVRNLLLPLFLSFVFFHSSSSTPTTDKQPIPALIPDVGYVLLGARSNGYNVRRDRFVVP
jgi:hypothetical protein